MVEEGDLKLLVISEWRIRAWAKVRVGKEKKGGINTPTEYLPVEQSPPRVPGLKGSGPPDKIKEVRASRGSGP